MNIVDLSEIKTPSRIKSSTCYAALCDVLPGGVNSPVRACQSVNHMPLIVQGGCGALLTDVDGHDYIDYCGSWGALLHGHAPSAVIRAISTRLTQGTTFGITTPLEGELARVIRRHFPMMEQLRFVSSGTEATMTALRLARAVTNRPFIIKFDGNYHGHVDHLLVNAGSGVLTACREATSAGIPSPFLTHTISIPYNDQAVLQEVFEHPRYQGQIAAVIVEPIAGNMGVIPPDLSFLHLLRDVTSAAQTLLIFDEVITGFRVALGGAQHLYGIVPDLTCLGKIVGGGFPAAALGGSREIMRWLAPLGPVYQAGTLSGNPIAMEAGLQTIALAEREGFYSELQAKTEQLLSPVRKAIIEKGWPAVIQQVGSMFTLFLGISQVRHLSDALQVDRAAYSRLFHTLFAQGIYIPPSPHEAWFVSSAHTPEHLHYTAEVIITFLKTEYGESV